MPAVYIIDDDGELRRSLHWLIDSAGIPVHTYASGSDFLENCDADVAGCLLLDVCMPEQDGLELQRLLSERGYSLPIIMMTGHAEVPMAIKSMKLGAFDFLEKPFSGEDLIEVVQSALQFDARERERRRKKAEYRRKVSDLTPRQQQILGLVIEGLATREIAEQLGLSEKTVEAHRARIMRKTETRNVAEMVRVGFEGLN